MIRISSYRHPQEGIAVSRNAMLEKAEKISDTSDILSNVSIAQCSVNELSHSSNFVLLEFAGRRGDRSKIKVLTRHGGWIDWFLARDTWPRHTGHVVAGR